MSISYDLEYGKVINTTINALNQTFEIVNSNRNATSVHVTGTWTGTLVLEVSNDNTNWTIIQGLKLSPTILITSITADGIYVYDTNSFSQIRIRSTAWTSGTATINIFGSDSAEEIEPTFGNNNTALPGVSQLVGGSDGTNIVPLAVDSQGRLVTSAVTGFGADFSFGDVSTAVIAKVLVRRTTYTEQTTNGQRSVASANANDTSAGTGARTLKITYFDQTGAGPFTETLTLNGTTRVNTVATNICFIEQMEVLTAGSGGTNAGIITLYTVPTSGGTAIGTINAGDNQTFWAHHYVSTGKTCNITGISCGHNGTTVGSGALFTLNAKIIGVANAIETQVSDFVRLYGQTSTFARSYQSPIKIVGPARIQMYVTPETSTATIYRGAFDFFEP